MTSRRRFLTLAGLALALTAAGMQPGLAGEDDHNRARHALEAGEVLPLRTVLERVEQEYPGQVMEVELDRDDGRWVYEIKVLRPRGILLKLKVDARDGTLLGSKQRAAKKLRPSGEKP